jgi:hypothetical protein
VAIATTAVTGTSHPTAVPSLGIAGTSQGTPIPSLGIAGTCQATPIPSLGIAGTCQATPIPSLGIAGTCQGTPIPSLGIAGTCQATPIPSLGIAGTCQGTPIPSLGIAGTSHGPAVPTVARTGIGDAVTIACDMTPGIGEEAHRLSSQRREHLMRRPVPSLGTTGTFPAPSVPTRAAAQPSATTAGLCNVALGPTIDRPVQAIRGPTETASRRCRLEPPASSRITRPRSRPHGCTSAVRLLTQRSVTGTGAVLTATT